MGLPEPQDYSVLAHEALTRVQSADRRAFAIRKLSPHWARVARQVLSKMGLANFTICSFALRCGWLGHTMVRYAQAASLSWAVRVSQSLFRIARM